MHCGLEVVLPTGQVMRTGMGGLPGNNTWQTFQYGKRPWVYSAAIRFQTVKTILTTLGRLWTIP